MGRKKLDKKEFKKIRSVRVSDVDMKLIKRHKTTIQSIINFQIESCKLIDEAKKELSKKEKKN